jgi:hypothetical protein
MSINVGIEGERDQGQDVRSNNGKHGLIQSLLLRLWLTSSRVHWVPRDSTR